MVQQMANLKFFRKLIYTHSAYNFVVDREFFFSCCAFSLRVKQNCRSYPLPIPHLLIYQRCENITFYIYCFGKIICLYLLVVSISYFSTACFDMASTLSQTSKICSLAVLSDIQSIPSFIISSK